MRAWNDQPITREENTELKYPISSSLEPPGLFLSSVMLLRNWHNCSREGWSKLWSRITGHRTDIFDSNLLGYVPLLLKICFDVFVFNKNLWNWAIKDKRLFVCVFVLLLCNIDFLQYTLLSFGVNFQNISDIQQAATAATAATAQCRNDCRACTDDFRMIAELALVREDEEGLSSRA